MPGHPASRTATAVGAWRPPSKIALDTVSVPW